MPQEYFGTRNLAVELAFQSGEAFTDPFNEIELDVMFSGPAGKDWRMPAFWAGGCEWRVRFAAPSEGEWSFRTVCSNTASDLHNRIGKLNIGPYEGNNPLLQHGPLRVSANRRHLEHADGTPFFWLGDTWWMGLCKRFGWPDDFHLLAADRVAKGFTVVQIVAGLYPDMPPFDDRGANEAGFPWTPDYARINPAYFDMADLRIQWLIRCGLVPCIVGCWGYFLPWMGVAAMKKHWRNIIARWGAYHAVWCLAGEGTMPYYLSTNRERDAELQKKGWTELAQYVRQIDPLRQPITIHPSSTARDSVDDDRVLDFDMLQTGHGGHESIPHTVRIQRAEMNRSPRMPVVNGEVCYEGILEGSREEVQRFMFWSAMLSGLAGFTYGANGIWQFNGIDEPFGPSPWGGAWGNQPWQTAYRLPGSQHVGLGGKLLCRYPWWKFEPHQEWVQPASTDDNPAAPFAAGIPDEVRVFYFPKPIFPWGDPTLIKGLGTNTGFQARLVDPKTGREYYIGSVFPDANGDWKLPLPPITQDWLLVLDRPCEPRQESPAMFA